MVCPIVTSVGVWAVASLHSVCRARFPQPHADVRLRIEVPEDALNTIRVSLKINNFADLKA